MYTLGIDIGSATSKCVILQDGETLVAKSLQTGGLGSDGPKAALDALWNGSGLTRSDMTAAIVTGYGRRSFRDADGEVSELTCHALGARFVFPDVRTVIDVGGQDAKVITLTGSGRMSGFLMNDKCAAGTGRFLEVMAQLLQMDVDALGSCAGQSDRPAAISSTCTVFAESEVISQLAVGVGRSDLAAGICESVASRVSALARRAGVTEPVCMSGGVAGNGAVRRGLEHSLGVAVSYDPLAQYFGAIGAALRARQQVKP